MWGLLRVTLLNSECRTEAAPQRDRGCVCHTDTAHAGLGHAALPAGTAAFLCPQPQAGTPNPILCFSGRFSVLGLYHALLTAGKWQTKGCLAGISVSPSPISPR